MEVIQQTLLTVLETYKTHHKVKNIHMCVVSVISSSEGLYIFLSYCVISSWLEQT